eukprot:Gb_19302 [translate_table: standard]
MSNSSDAVGKRLEGRVAIITGAATGIGESSARLFAANGAKVILADVQDEPGKSVAASIGPAATYMHCDVTREDDVRKVVEKAVEMYGRLDVMYSNAGRLGKQSSIMEMDMDEFDHVMATNVRGAGAAIKHAARAMLAAKIKGSIICTASVSATVAGTTPHPYSVSKHAIVGLVKTAASELGKHGIRVNCVSPFGVATPMLVSAWEETKLDPLNIEADCSALSNLQGVVLKARDVANAVLFLASDDAAFISGHNLAVDGGFSVVNHSFGLYK